MCGMVGGGMTNSRGDQRNSKKTLLHCWFVHHESLVEPRFCILEASVVPSYDPKLFNISFLHDLYTEI
jgi:hypothetical protein